ncbi:MAG: 3-octaprenyl-4-hydroxybenzoate carboxy-lyase [Chloroflexi bacterium RBG_19FT_COMBO_50_10]|nr:MAG: 3-octaprenyl-4-hydroxybenzoate carboxy-lyase [Chloroflexi bacterium RBG_16_47_49]OGO65014.1 MAG: 3-octaprenyl-4-hydroxybenzoate carboxy-lyase [Chloroflexi bacterium RBG_19FT_COMBO_50_10]
MEPQYSNLPEAKISSPHRLIVGITGASGAILGVRLLEVLKPTAVETHLVLSESARLTIVQETDWHVEDVLSLADVSYDFHDVGAAIASGSFSTLGMTIIPCSIKTLSAVANSYTDDLVSRAADVTLKEGRPLVLVVRETPFHPGHLRLMSEAAASGAIIFPPTPAFYIRPRSMEDLINNTVGRILARLGIENNLYQEWRGQTSP